MSMKALMAATTALTLTAGFAFAYSTDSTNATVEMNAETQSDIAQATDSMETADELADVVSDNKAAVTAAEISDIAEDTTGADGSPEAADMTLQMAGDDTAVRPETNSDIATEMTLADAMAVDLPESPFIGMTVGELIGMNVEGVSGEAVGEIDYVISRNGEMKAVIGVGGLLGLGEHTVALSLSAFDLEDDTLSVEETEASLRDMPEIDESEIDGLDDDTPLS